MSLGGSQHLQRKMKWSIDNDPLAEMLEGLERNNDIYCLHCLRSVLLCVRSVRQEKC